MQITRFHSHLNGYEWLLVHYPQLWSELKGIVGDVDAAQCRTKVTKEKDMNRRLLYSSVEISRRLDVACEKSGWKRSRKRYWVRHECSRIRKMPRAASNARKAEEGGAGPQLTASGHKIDFSEGRVAIGIGLAKSVCSLFADHLAAYVFDQIDLGIEVLPMKSMQQQMSSGPAYYEGALYDLVRQGRGVPAVPLVLVGVAP